MRDSKELQFSKYYKIPMYSHQEMTWGVQSKAALGTESCTINCMVKKMCCSQ